MGFIAMRLSEFCNHIYILPIVTQYKSQTNISLFRSIISAPSQKINRLLRTVKQQDKLCK